MAFYKVTYSGLDATYGPSYIEADSPEQAKQKFGDCFTPGERAFCMTAREVSAQEMRKALKLRKENEVRNES